MTAPDRRELPARPHFTGRAAVLALVVCAIALSLAYPVREYIAERRQVDQLQVQSQQLAYQLKQLQAQRKLLSTPDYIERQARDRLHWCMPTEICYVIVGGGTPQAGKSKTAGTPWYARLWSSVQRADKPLPAGRGEPAQRHG